MFPLLVVAAAQIDKPSDIVVGGWDRRPTLTVAKGYRMDLAPLKTAAEECGFSRTWMWSDDTVPLSSTIHPNLPSAFDLSGQ